MFTFRGDAHKFYLKLNNSSVDYDDISEIREINHIITFYKGLENNQLKKIKYQMLKELNASGSIPLVVTTVPWLLFIFSKPLLNLLFGDFSLWIPFVLLYVTLLLMGIYLHFHEKAWAKVHVEIIADVLLDRENGHISKKGDRKNE